ncbi:MAG: L,D-transpeptidase family protein [Candidatus Pacebacteria bacterium]|nr:L,D-transpeptidase family protein [Candidatus Paceibacterota bacterium]
MKSTYNQTLTFLVIVCSIVLFASRNEASLTSTEPVVVHAEAVQKPVTRQVTTPAQGAYEYIEITSSCGPQFEGMCIPAYAGPGTEYEEVIDLRNGMILKIKNRVTVNGQTWYRVYFDEWLRYADRVEGDWYVPAVAGRVVKSDGEQILGNQQVTTTKRIVIDLSDHMIYAYDGNYLYLTTKVSTGIDSTPTPLGTFSVYKKTPSRYMQGPLPGVSDVPFDLPGVPWNLYFTLDGAVIHGSYWHDRYGTDQSNGCINLPPEIAKILYDWAPLGTPVIVQR